MSGKPLGVVLAQWLLGGEVFVEGYDSYLLTYERRDGSSLVTILPKMCCFSPAFPERGENIVSGPWVCVSLKIYGTSSLFIRLSLYKS